MEVLYSGHIIHILDLIPGILKDKYADYWQENRNQTLINWKWCSLNPKKFAGYSEDCWGLTASYSIEWLCCT